MRVSAVFAALQKISVLIHPSIVEFASPEDAQRAIRELSEQPLLGRPVFIREVSTLVHHLHASTNSLS
jgi:RNA recognition motif-containing protein